MKDILHSRFEMKQMSEPKDGFATFTGYASVFDYTDAQMDVVKKGAFSNSIVDRKNVKMLWQHDAHQPIGIYPVMHEDQKGLYVEGQICLDAAKGKECHALMKQGAIDSLSIGFMTKDAEYDKKTGVRSIKAVDLYEISPVTFPANDMAMIDNVKSIISRASALKDMTIKEFERKIRDVFQCSQNEAKAIASKGFKEIHRDGDDLVFDPWAKILGSFAIN